MSAYEEMNEMNAKYKKKYALASWFKTLIIGLSFNIWLLTLVGLRVIYCNTRKKKYKVTF